MKGEQSSRQYFCRLNYRLLGKSLILSWLAELFSQPSSRLVTALGGMKLFNSQGSKRGKLQRGVAFSSKIVLSLSWTLAFVLLFAVLHRPFSSVLSWFTSELSCAFFEIQLNTYNNKYWPFMSMVTFPSNFKRQRFYSSYYKESFWVLI